MNQGNKIWVDDERAAPENWIWAKNVEQAKLFLLQGNVEDMSLDYDFDNPRCPTCDSQCGYQDDDACQKGCQCHTYNGQEVGTDLVQWMIKWNMWPRNRPVVHSTNPRGAQEMKSLIDLNFRE